jgi:hypothetical protein
MRPAIELFLALELDAMWNADMIKPRWAAAAKSL